MEWQQFVMNLETLNPASVEAILIRHGAQSVTFSDAGDRPVLEPGPGETPLWNRTRITGLFALWTVLGTLWAWFAPDHFIWVADGRFTPLKVVFFTKV